MRINSEVIDYASETKSAVVILDWLAVSWFIVENMTTRPGESVVITTGRVYRILFINGQVLDFAVEVRLALF